MSTPLVLRNVPCYMLSDLTIDDLLEENDPEALHELLPRVTIPDIHFEDPFECPCPICRPPYRSKPIDLWCVACLAQKKHVDVSGDGLFAKNFLAQKLPGAVLCDACFALAEANGICSYCGRPLDFDEILGTYSCPSAEDMLWDETLPMEEEQGGEPAEKHPREESEETTQKRQRA